MDARVQILWGLYNIKSGRLTVDNIRGLEVRPALFMEKRIAAMLLEEGEQVVRVRVVPIERAKK